MLESRPGAERYASRVEGITSSHLEIAMPMDKSTPIILFPGIKFYGKVRIPGSVWHFTSIFVDKRPLPIPIWITELPSNLKLVQQRAFVRLPTLLPIRIRPLSETNTFPPIDVATRDISGGGLQFIANEKNFPPVSKLFVSIDLPELGHIEALCEVVRCQRPDPDSTVNWVAVKFVEIAERERDKIVKYIFKKQVERKQKGL